MGIAEPIEVVRVPQRLSANAKLRAIRAGQPLFQVRVIPEQLVLVDKLDSPSGEIFARDWEYGLQHVGVRVQLLSYGSDCGPRSSCSTNLSLSLAVSNGSRL